MKEISKKIIAIFVIMLMIINSSLLTIISVAAEDIKNVLDKSKAEVKNEINIEKYVNYSFEDNKGILLKLDLKTGIEYKEDQEYKAIKQTKTEITSPQINGEFPEKVELQAISTKATNGSDTAKDYEIKYVEENQPLGTAGSLRLIEEDFEQPFIVTNCDILIHADYEDVYRYHRESGNELTIVSALKNIVVPYGVIHSSENGAVQSMEEKPKLSYFVNTGMYILNPELKKEIPEDTFYHMTDLTDKLLKENRKVGMYPISEDSFLDMGEFEEMHRMEKKLDLKSE